MIQFVKNNKNWIGYPVVAIATASVVLFLTPSKTTIKELTSELTKTRETNAELKLNNEKLIVTNEKLSKKTRETGTIITYADGSTITTYDNSTESEQISNKMTSIKESYESKLKEKDAEIAKIKEYNKTEINKKIVTVALLAGVGKDTFTSDLIVKANVLGPLGVAGGFGMSWTRAPLIINTNWGKPDIIGKAGLTLDL